MLQWEGNSIHKILWLAGDPGQPALAILSRRSLQFMCFAHGE